MTSKWMRGLGPAAILMLGACGGDGVTAPGVGSVTASLDKTTIVTGETAQASALVLDDAGAPLTGRTLSWSSATPAVAAVDGSGMVTAVAPGTSVLTATVEGKSGSVTITVIPAVATITVSLGSSSLSIGATTQATAVLKDAGGAAITGRTVTWSSGTQSVATVNTSGVVTAVSAGSSVITAANGGKTGTATVTVTPNPPGAFTLSQPQNRLANVSATPSFSWASSSGAATYTIEVATTASFGAFNVISQSGVTTNGYTATTVLQAGTVYFWRVTAVNTGGSVAASNGPFEFSIPYSAGANPSGVAVTPDGTKALVVNSSGSGSVTVVDLVSRSVTGTIPIGSFPGAVAIRADGAQAVAANANSLAVIDLATNTVTKTIAMPCVGTTLYDIAYTPDGLKVVLPDLSSGCTAEGMRIVTIASSATQFVDLSTGAVAQGIAVTPDGASALITLGITGTAVKRVNLATLAVTTIAGTGPTFGVAVTPNNATAVIAGGQQETLKRIDLGTNVVTVGAAFSSNTGGHNVAITPDGTKAVVVGDFSAAVIALSDNTITATFPNGGSSVAITPDGKYALITTGSGSGASGTVRVIRIP